MSMPLWLEKRIDSLIVPIMVISTVVLVLSFIGILTGHITLSQRNGEVKQKEKRGKPGNDWILLVPFVAPLMMDD